jgi:PAS domain S-box-containing protein
MKDEGRIKAQPAKELEAARQRHSRLKTPESKPKQAQEVLWGGKERYQQLFENANDGIVTLTLDGTITSVNGGLEAMLGWSRKELIGQHYRKIAPPSSVALGEERIRGFLAGDRLPSIFAAEMVRKDGSIVPVEARTRPMRNKEGKPIGFQGIYRDISERKRAEVALLKAKEAAEAANRAKSEFLAMMSHELRNSLNVIIGYNDLLLDGTFGDLPKEQADTLQRVNQSAHELLDLVTAVLDLSRLEVRQLPVKLKKVWVAEVIKEVEAETQGLRKQSSLEFVWRVDAHLPPIRMDPGKMKVVLKNLIGNAVKFTEEGSITVNAYVRDEGVEISVTDTGIGIPQQALSTIFEPFRQVDNSTRRQYGGTGLGLHIVKRLLELLGGTITVESKVGRGSTFRVWVPTGKN